MSTDDEQRIAELEQQLAAAQQDAAARDQRLAEAEAREQAVAQILRLISANPTDEQAVFRAILLAILAINGGGMLYRLDGETLRHIGALTTTLNGPTFFDGEPHPELDRVPARDEAVRAAIEQRRTIYLPDIESPEAAAYPATVRGLRAYGRPRSLLAVPILSEGAPVGLITSVRAEVAPFDEARIRLVEMLADQAGIAIANAQRFQELEARNQDLSEALERQRALAEVLQIISSSPTDMRQALDAVAARVVAVCAVEDVVIFRLVDSTLELVAHDGPARTRRPGTRIPCDTSSVAGAAVLDRATICVDDISRDGPDRFPLNYRMYLQDGVRGYLAAPLIHHGIPIGVIGVRRSLPQSFTRQQISMVEAFAHQAAIAIENARLFEELQQRTQELTRTVEELRALGLVGQTINSSLDLPTVLATVCRHAVELSGADVGGIWAYDPATDTLHIQGVHGYDPAALAAFQTRFGSGPRAVDHFPIVAEAIRRAEPVQVDDPGHQGPEAPERELQRATGMRAALAVPLLRDGAVQGALVVRRRTPGAFPEPTIALLRTFADQSAIAIQNARLYREIEQQRSQLEEVSRHKSEFLASMSHELRTPLNAIIGFSEVLLDPTMPVDEAIRGQFLENIHASGQHLLGLINDILDLSKVEAGKLELHPETFDLAEALQGVHGVVRAMADKKQQTLTLDLPPDLGHLEHDPGRFKQVLFNLLSNAVKFTPEGGSITTKVALTPVTPFAATPFAATPFASLSPNVGGGELAAASAAMGTAGSPLPTLGEGIGVRALLEISVTDTGIGIAPEHHEQVFEEFRQIDSGYARKQQGTGLGLSLVRRLARLMGGEVTVQSALGEGSTFTIRLPRRQGLLVGNPDAEGATVLVVEDDPAAAELLAYHLGRGGYAVERVGTAEEAVARARSNRPAAITLDLLLPDERDGWALLRRLKADPATGTIPVVVISVLEDERRSGQAGAAAHLVKPVEGRELLGTLARVTRLPADTPLEEVHDGR